MIKHFIYFITLDKFFKLISNRYSKGTFYFINTALGIFSGILCFYSLKFISANNSEIGVPLLLGSLGIIFFAELLNISSKNSFISIYTLNKIDVYPISKPEHIKNLFLSNFFNFRSIYFIVLFSLVIYFSINFNVLYFFQVLIIFTLFYFFATLLFTLGDYGFAFLVKLFDKKANYFVIGFFMILMFSTSFINKTDIDLEMDKIIINLTHILNFILNK